MRRNEELYSFKYDLNKVRKRRASAHVDGFVSKCHILSGKNPRRIWQSKVGVVAQPFAIYSVTFIHLELVRYIFKFRTFA